MEDGDDLDFVSSEHDRLISAVTKLDKTQHITAPTRNEPTNINSEFNLVKRSNKLDLLNAVQLLEDTAHHVQISKKLKATQNKSQILSKPLEKPQAEKIKRETGYLETKEKIGRWDAIVARSRTVDFVSFPLKTLKTKENKDPTKLFLSKLKLKSPLEKELDEVDPPLQVQDEEDDEDKKFPMTYQEMLEHRQHLAKLRAKESYKAAKAKRQSKIKSKKYHRILKKERLKQQLKEFEELQVKNPEEALKKLQELEKVRALERHTLRHKNTGKWAKSKLVRAKYDKEVRQQLAEQLSVSRSLTHKVQDTASTDDEDDNEKVLDLSLSQDPLNPWMMKRPDKSNIDEEFNFGYKKYLKDKMYKKKELSDSESDAENAPGDLKVEKDDALEVLRYSMDKMTSVLTETDIPDMVEESKKQTTNVKPEKQSKKQNIGPPVATTAWIVDNITDKLSNVNMLGDISEEFDSFESKVSKKVEQKLDKLRKYVDKLEKTSRSSGKKNSRKRREPKDNLEYLKLKKQKVKAIIDEALIETNKDSYDDTKNEEIEVKNIDLQKVPSTVEPVGVEGTNTNIDPNRFIEVKPKYLNTAISKGVNDVDLLDDDEQVVPKVDIEDVFEEDDVVASFRQEKEDEMNKDKPEQIDLSLPGWGSWGGKGVKAPKRKRNRFIGKPAPKMQRRDENKGDVIILETKDPKLTVHKVTDVPFPFNSVKDYEASIRAPLGNTFIPEKAHKRLIRPSVITKAGTVIEPMDEEELLIPRKSFRNEAIIKLLAKK